MSILETVQTLLGIYSPVDETKIFGCDTSHWTGVVNWNMAKERGMTFTIGKAMDGTFPTKYFIENYNGAKKAGLITGMYTWLYKGSVISTSAQAKAFAAYYKQFDVEIPPVVDFEWTASGNPGINDLYDFLVRFEDLTGKKCMIYTAKGYWQPYGSTNSFYAKYPLWIAQYNVSKPDSFAPFYGNQKLWQFTAHAEGAIYGYPFGTKNADMNYFNGTKADFLNWLGVGVSVPEQPTTPPIVVDPNIVKVNVSVLNVRSGAGTTNPIVGTLVYGASVKILEYSRPSQTEVWGRIDVGKWICLLLGSSVFTSKTNFSDIPVNPVQPPVIPDGRMATVIISLLNVRSGASTTSAIVGTLKLNDRVKIISRLVDEKGNTWGNIDIGKWICMIYGGVAYVKFDDPVSVTPYVKSFTVPSTGQFVQAKHDYARADWEFKPRSITLNYKDGGLNALPETVPLLNRKEEFFPLSEEWQFFWFELIKLAAGGQLTDEQLLQKWASLTEDGRAFTDNHAVQNGFCDYVRGINIGAKPMMIKALTTGGNVSKVLVDNGTQWVIECLNVTLPPPDVNDVWKNKKWLFQWATQETTVKLSNGTWKVIPFPQLNPYNGCPVPVCSLDGKQIITKANSIALTNGKTYNIYNG